MVERIAELVRDKKIEGISDLRDESDRDGYRGGGRAQGATPPPTWCSTSSTASRPLAIDLRGQYRGARRRPAPLGHDPEGPADVLHRVPRGCGSRGAPSFLLGKAARPAPHVLVGLAIAVANIDEMIRLIRASRDANEGARGLDGARLAGARGSRP